MRALKAEVKNGKIYVDGAAVEDAVMLCEGKSESEGFFVIDKDKYFYLTKTTQDLTAALNLIIEALQKITLQSLGTPSQGWASPPTLPTDLITVIKKAQELIEKQA